MLKHGFGRECHTKLAKEVGAKFCLAASGRDLGVESGVGRRRRTGIQQARSNKAAKRLKRAKGMIMADKRARKVVWQ